VSIEGRSVDGAVLFDRDYTTSLDVPIADAGKASALDLDLGSSQVIRGVSLGVSTAGNPFALFMPTTDDGPEVQVSDDGKQYRPLTRLPRGRLPQYTVRVSASSARHVRILFHTPQAMGGPPVDIPGLPSPRHTNHVVTELTLHTWSPVHRFEDKAGFAPTVGVSHLDGPAAAGEAIAKTSVLDLTSRLRPNGTLDWTPPPGRWTVLRMGYSLTGKENGPASPEATGLEVDKLSALHVRAYFSKYLDMYRDATGGLMGTRGLQFLVTDSWEANTQNWTDDMPEEFAKRRGYDLRPWLPALTGRIVQSAEATDRFLWDFRATIAELTVANHYDLLTTLLRERGMGRYSESHEGGRALIADGMEVKRASDVPMSAMWTGRDGPLGVPSVYAADIRESASVAHIYGQNVVAAESLTAAGGAYTFSPRSLKATADAELSQGLNRFVIHTSVHQPLDDRKPGLGLGPFGQWFTRHETWAEQAGAWIEYLARSCHLLQQGRFAADVLYYYGDDSNVTALFGDKAPEVPPGYGFDYANADVVLNRISVSNGRLVTKTGMAYRVLVLDANARSMQLSVLKKLRELVRAGAVLTGPRPERSVGLLDDEAQFKAIVSEVWGVGKGVRTVGAGRVYVDTTLPEVLAAEKVAPDFDHTRPLPDTALLFVHRRLPGAEIYWVNNRQPRVESVDAIFRVTGRTPELWHPETGAIERVSYRTERGRTIVPLRLEAEDAVFIVFREPTTTEARTVPVPVSSTAATIDGPWEIAFQPDRGAPPAATLQSLQSWSLSPDPGIKYFSGTATYSKTVEAPAAWFAGCAEVWLDLGDVKELAEVSLNGKKLPVQWRPPYRVDVTGAMRPGPNRLEVAVTNLWVNRVVGDQQPAVARTFTYTPLPFYRADAPLLPSGLLGPVTVSIRKRP
jgi:hypothetical protein